jgi:multidrug efflux pump subunit AcrA (membrane-fusion protein)
MLSLISTLGGLLISGLPKLLEFFQAKADQAHERDLAKISAERDLQMAAQGFAAQQRIEELRSEQVAMQTDAQMTQAALDHDKKVLEKASKWVANYVGTVRPTVTYIFILELVAINAAITYYAFTDPNLIRSMDDFLKVSTVIFSEEEMSMLGGILGFWFGSRSWSKK